MHSTGVIVIFLIFWREIYVALRSALVFAQNKFHKNGTYSSSDLQHAELLQDLVRDLHASWSQIGKFRKKDHGKLL